MRNQAFAASPGFTAKDNRQVFKRGYPSLLLYIPNSHLRFTYWSGIGGDADLPENYSEITYTLNPAGTDQVALTYSRIKIPTALETQLFQGHLPSMLEEIKKLAEE